MVEGVRAGTGTEEIIEEEKSSSGEEETWFLGGFILPVGDAKANAFEQMATLSEMIPPVRRSHFGGSLF